MVMMPKPTSGSRASESQSVARLREQDEADAGAKPAAAISCLQSGGALPAGQIQHAGHGAGAGGADEEAQRARVAAEQVAREHRHQRSVRRRHEADEGHQPDQVAARREIPRRNAAPPSGRPASAGCSRAAGGAVSRMAASAASIAR